MPPEGPAQTALLPRIGQILDGKYELVRLLGEGGMAFVFEAKHLRLKQRVAIKILAPEMARDREIVARFEDEARAVAKLRTPHVARVMDVDVTADGLPFIVMDFLEGRDLDGEIAARGRLPLDEACDYILQACAAVIEAHEAGIVHRDLKPANLFLATEGQERVVKVLDFGISKVAGEASRLTAAGAVMGTVLYMSPEQIRAAKDVDVRADLWSLGVILFELVAGRPPWSGSSQQIAAAIVSGDAPDVRSFVQVPDAFAALVAQLLARDRDERVATARSLVAQLGPYARPGSPGGIIAEQVSGGTGSRLRAVAPGHAVKSKTVPLRPNASWPPAPAPATGDGYPTGSVRQGAPSAPAPGGAATSAGSASGRGSAAPVVGAGATQLLAGPSLPAASVSTRRPAGVGAGTTPGGGRALVVAMAIVGLFGAIGVVLLAAWSWRRAEATRTTAPASIVDPAAAPASAGASSSGATAAPGALPNASAPPGAASPLGGPSGAPSAKAAPSGAAPAESAPAGTTSAPALPAPPPTGTTPRAKGPGANASKRPGGSRPNGGARRPPPSAPSATSGDVPFL